MLPAAPARLSITIWRPSPSDIGGAMKRATMSLVLPAANGTMRRMGFVGYWACAGEGIASGNASATTPARIDDFIACSSDEPAFLFYSVSVCHEAGVN